MSKNINLNNFIGQSYFDKNLYLKDKIKLNNIINSVLISLNSKKDVFHSLSKNFNFDFEYSVLSRFNRYKSVILIGMGGSVLGSEAIYSFCSEKNKKKFFFLDNLDQLKIEKIKNKVNLKNCLFIIISKSGNTLETLVNSNLFKDKINNKNTIIITEKKNNILNTYAKKKKILTINHKDYIGGRYSVLSEVGMLPAFFMGLEIKNFRKSLLDFFNSNKKKNITRQCN